MQSLGIGPWIILMIAIVVAIVFYMRSRRVVEPETQGSKETSEERIERIRRTGPERADRYRRGESVESLAEEYGMTVRGVIASLAKEDAYVSDTPAGIPYKIRAMEKVLNDLKKFTATRRHFGSNGASGVAIDDTTGSVCLLHIEQRNATHRIVSYRDIISTEVVEDGVTLTQTTQSDKLGRAIVGGLAFGGVGAIVGGLTGNATSKTEKTIARLDLKMLIRDSAAPAHTVSFLHIPTGSSTAD
jgi:hypothetical protein